MHVPPPSDGPPSDGPPDQAAPEGPPTLEADRGLLDAFRRGDRAALGRVAALYIDDVARTIRAGVRVSVDGAPTRLGNDLPEHDIENLVQETFAKAFAHKARLAYDGLRPYGAYLGTIARNLLVDHGRRAAVRRKASFEVADLEALPDGQAGLEAEHSLEARELSELIEAFIAELPDEEAALFRHRYQEQLTMKEAGARLGLSEIQVRRRDTRLRQALFEKLRRAGYLEQVQVRIGGSLL